MFRICSNARSTIATTLLAAICAAPLGAQLPARGSPANPDNPRTAALRDLDHVSERQKARERAADEKRQREFMERLTEFATAWNALMKVCEKGVWSAKEARHAHKAFERLVRSEGWVENSKQ